MSDDEESATERGVSEESDSFEYLTAESSEGEMNAELGEPSFGSAGIEHHMW